MSVSLKFRELTGRALPEAAQMLMVKRRLQKQLQGWESDPAFADIRSLNEEQLTKYLETEWTRAKELDEKLNKLTAALSVAVTVGGVVAKTIFDGLAPTLAKTAITILLFVSMGMFLFGAIIGFRGLRPKPRYGYGARYLSIIEQGGECARKEMRHAASGFQITNLVRSNEASAAINMIRNGVIAFALAIALSFFAPAVLPVASPAAAAPAREQSGSRNEPVLNQSLHQPQSIPWQDRSLKNSVGAHHHKNVTTKNAMCDALVWSLDAITSINWLEVIKALAPVATAVIAFLALKNWRRQDKAKREAEFLDALIESAHTYIAEMSKPVTLFEMAKIGMTSHAPTWESGEQADKAVKGAVAYVQKNGEHEAKRLLEVLEAVQPSAIELRSLAAKGQVFKFDGYAKCQNAIALLTWHFDRIEAFTAVIGSPTWNWEHPEVLKHLKDVMAIEPNDVRKSLKENNVAVLEFAGETYKRIYG